MREAGRRSHVTARDWILGRNDAPVTMLEYGDFQCPFCALARPVLETLVIHNPWAVRLVFRNFPLTTIHPHAQQAAEAAEAAGAQSHFWQMHDRLFTHQKELDEASLLRHAEVIGLDVDRFASDLVNHRHLDKVRNDFRVGIRDGVNGTPTIFLNGQRYDGSRDYDSMLTAIEALLTSARPGLELR